MGATATHCERSLLPGGSWCVKSMWRKTWGGGLLCACCVGFNASSACKGNLSGQNGRPMLSILNWGVGRTALRFLSLPDANSIHPDGDTAQWMLTSKHFFSWVVSKSTGTWETSSTFIFVAYPTSMKWRGGRYTTYHDIFPPFLVSNMCKWHF